jgi:hypothetical protein
LPQSTFLAGGGDAGALIRSFDWKATPLGEPDDWPEALRTALTVCLNSAIPSAVYWGPEFHTLYNEAWASREAGQHPWAMGRPARESRGDIWDTLEPQFRSVVETGRGVGICGQKKPLSTPPRPRPAPAGG